MKHMKVLSLGQNRGAPRLWLQGRFPAAAGFVPGVRFSIDKATRHLTLRLAEDGSHTVSRKARGDKVDPVIDINSQEVLELFEGLGSLRVVIRDSEILITPLESELRAQERTRRLERRLDNNVAAAVAVIARVNPACFALENVPTYAATASAEILRSQLRDLGYEVHEREFMATEFGDLEARKRWCMVAVTRGIRVNLDHVLPPAFRVRQLSEVLDPPEAVASRWSEMRGLKDKQERDLEAGKNFRMQVFDGSENSISTLTKGLGKNRSTDPKFAHPQNPDLLRVPTSAEHARAKGVDPQLVAGLSETDAHQVLGQGICVAPFRALFRYLARQIRAARSGLAVAQPTVLTANMLFAA